MVAKYLAAICFLAAIVSYEASKISYCQLSTHPAGSCVKVKLTDEKDGIIKRVTSWIKDGKEERATIHLKRVESTETGTKYDIVDEDGKSNGFIYEEEKEKHVVKVIVKHKEDIIVLTACSTDSRQPTSEDEEVIKTFCKGMKKVDNKNCKS